MNQSRFVYGRQQQTEIKHTWTFKGLFTCLQIATKNNLKNEANILYTRYLDMGNMYSYFADMGYIPATSFQTIHPVTSCYGTSPGCAACRTIHHDILFVRRGGVTSRAGVSKKMMNDIKCIVRQVSKWSYGFIPLFFSCPSC